MTTPPKSGFVAIIGEPNVGKSTLMNAMLGTKLSIVSPKPQTTRRSVLGIFTEGTEESGTQIVFFDTPGVLSKPSYELHRSMLDFVKSSVEGADAILIVVDVQKLVEKPRTKKPSTNRPSNQATKQPSNQTEERGAKALQTLMMRLQMRLETVEKPVIVALNKMDALHDKKLALPVMDALMKLPFVSHVAPISALENKFVDELLAKLKDYMPQHEFYYDAEMLSTQPQRFFVSELIREVIFTRYREEIPYSTEVSIVEFKERERGKWYISADIVVERDTQKQILIGKGGSSLKETGSLARKAIEQYLECSVFLELFVKVREDWRNSTAHLRSFGYGQS
ncbi:MAG: GTPase Era [Candidatus Kapabacteria bacterium]|jgi:GTP-binding protein Era|nr:GTPase Era [Candidatus Kapabacteria bacterium]